MGIPCWVQPDLFACSRKREWGLRKEINKRQERELGGLPVNTVTASILLFIALIHTN